MTINHDQVIPNGVLRGIQFSDDLDLNQMYEPSLIKSWTYSCSQITKQLLYRGLIFANAIFSVNMSYSLSVVMQCLLDIP